MLLKKIKISNFQYLILFLLLTLWLFVRSNQSDLSNFIQTHHLFNYEHEFLKRALVGEILRLSFENLNYKVIYILSLFFLILLSIVFFKIVFINFNKDTNITKLIFSVMVFVSPLTLQHFIFDFGRFDIINMLITLLCFLIIKKFYENTLLIIIFIFPLLNCMLLIHEGSFFMFIPMIFGYWFFKNSKKTTFAIQLFLFLTITLMTYKISTLGLSTKFTYSEYYNLLLNKYFLLVENSDSPNFINPSGLAVEVLYKDLFNTYDPNIRYSIVGEAKKIGFSYKSILDNLILILLLSPIFFVVFSIYRSFFKLGNFKLKLFLISPLSSFALFILAYDHMRWWAIMFTNILLIILKLSEEKDLYLEIILTNVKKYKNLYFFLILEAFIIGPVKFYSTFDVIENLDIYQKITLSN